MYGRLKSIRERRDRQFS